jgi:hypothetical protein
MKLVPCKSVRTGPLWGALVLAACLARPGLAQPAAPGPVLLPPPSAKVATSRDAQRNALQAVQAQTKWFRNALKMATRLAFPANAGQMTQESFDRLSLTFENFRSTLTPVQLGQGSLDLDDLEEGLDVIQEALDDFHAQLAAGRPTRMGIDRACKGLDKAAAEWERELVRVSRRLRVGS